MAGYGKGRGVRQRHQDGAGCHADQRSGASGDDLRNCLTHQLVNRKRTGTSATAGTAVPPRVAGTKRHCSTARSAASSRLAKSTALRDRDTDSCAVRRYVDLEKDSALLATSAGNFGINRRSIGFHVGNRTSRQHRGNCSGRLRGGLPFRCIRRLCRRPNNVPSGFGNSTGLDTGGSISGFAATARAASSARRTKQVGNSPGTRYWSRPSTTSRRGQCVALAPSVGKSGCYSGSSRSVVSNTSGRTIEAA
jgi:hypothetical protein